MAKPVTAAIKATLQPVLVAAGFAGRFPNYRRVRDARIDLLSIQYAKYGGAFVIESGSLPRGPLHTSWGEVVPEEKLVLEHALLQDRARLQPSTGPHSLYTDWFVFGEAPAPAAIDAAIAQAIALWPQMEAWLRDRIAGPNVHRMLVLDQAPSSAASTASP